MKKLFFFTLIISLTIQSCSNDDSSEKDTTKPEINLTIADAFPTSCSSISKGSTIPFKALFTDNQELGAYSINIHNNFDHHSHDTEVDACNLDAIKDAVNPWILTLTYSIPENTKEFISEQQILVPTDIDTGDYHFMIQLTDAEGWATMKGINIKITE
ncbi:DUF4625 domain-containing protein [Flavobacterium sp. NRK F10]|uniref:DUF4625 domain-containing protein n=1 Tax=Flavobacterium sediminis TaxID=2201181 RepID=A0A2U8QTL4_9FLAO|nr:MULTISPECIES: DUF4625 domain-containing protein [Flavobacterium]AWM13431.1 hypothetical protein DI487_05855 [Flavobacterium sediminis]MCO6174552.1 DUF4625 domain-containing protein [Flavobacterium sp. NRK F10]